MKSMFNKCVINAIAISFLIALYMVELPYETTENRKSEPFSNNKWVKYSKKKGRKEKQENMNCNHRAITTAHVARLTNPWCG
jgi:hypothetical protein